MLKKFAAAALVLSLAVPAFAQSPATPGMDKRETNMEKRIDQGKATGALMEKRIDQGKATGALNEKEAARMEKRKAHLEKAEERAKADGTVTPAERKRLDRKAERLSKDIHNEKHDKQTAAPASEAAKQ